MYNDNRMLDMFDTNQNKNKQKHIPLFNHDKTLLCTKL